MLKKLFFFIQIFRLEKDRFIPKSYGTKKNILAQYLVLETNRFIPESLKHEFFINPSFNRKLEKVLIHLNSSMLKKLFFYTNFQARLRRM